MIPSARWDSDSDAWESDFDDEEAPSYFRNNLKTLYESMQNRKVVSPTRTSVSDSLHCTLLAIAAILQCYDIQVV